MIAQLLVVAVVAAMAAIAVLAARRPILFRMAARHATRRPRQTATVVAGLMIGTAIIASALVAGGSAGSAVRGAVYESLGHIDESVSIQGYPFFPEDVYHRLAAHPETQWFDGIAPNVVWGAAADAGDLFEPLVMLVGYEPEADAAFGDFTLPGGGRHDGRGLGPRQAIVTSEMADALELMPGDTFRVRATIPFDPARPLLTPLSGTALPAPTTYGLDVPAGADAATVVVAWDPRPPSPLPGLPAQHVRLELEGPDGTVQQAASTPLDPQVPLWLNVTAPAGEVLQEGTWLLRVSGDGVTYEGAAVVLVPTYGGAAPADPGAWDIHPPTVEADYTVAAVAAGGRATQFDLGTAAFVPLAPLQDLLARPGEINVLKFSNPGPARNGGAGTGEAMQRLERALADVDGPHPSYAALAAEPLKEEYLELADDTGRLFTGMLIFAGSLSIITGLLLIINIFTMLADERRSELGMARAVGLSRGGLTRLFVFEGSLYAVAAAAVGAALGLLLAYGMVAGLNALMAGAGPNRFPPIPFVVEVGDLLIAFSAGTLLTLVTVFAASRRLGRLNIVRAIRRIPEPERRPAAWHAYGWPLAGLGAASAAAGWVVHAAGGASGSLSLQVGGPLLVAVGVGMGLRGRVRRRILDPALALLLAAYYAATYFLISRYADLDEANIVGPVRGVLLTLCVVVAVSYWDAGPRAVGRVLSRVRRLRAVAMPAMAYPQHRRLRTGMTLAMFSLVILSIGFFSIFGALFERDPATMTGGFDIEATTTIDVDDLDSYARGTLPAGLVQARHHLAHWMTQDPDFFTVNGQQTGQFGPPEHNVYGYDEAFARDNGFRLLWRDDAYTTDQEAYLDVLARDDAVIVAYQYSTGPGGQDLAFGVGDRLTVGFRDGPRAFTIVGVQEQYHFPGIWLPEGTAMQLFQARDMFLFRLEDGVDAGEAAKTIERTYRDAGMDAEASQELVAKEQETFRQILGAMKLFLGLGLIVGVLSLGIVTSRSVLERRQEIGMLRAIGYRPGQVRTMFVLEVTFIVALGAAIGLACSILVTYGLWFALIKDLQYPYVIPWAEVLLLVAAAYVVALLATAAPIRRSARIPPAEAVRAPE